MRKLLLFFILITSQLFYSQSDCVSAIPVCGSSGVSYTPSGFGTTQESPLGGCLSTEHFSVWYKFNIATAGTLTFVIDPNSAGTDYDWAVYGPNVQCGSLGNPVRCSFSAGGGPTGLNMTSLDTSENAGTDNLGNPADRFVKYMDVLPGESYYLIVDNFSSNTTGFALNWGGTATLSSAFTDPTLAPNPFIAPGVPNTAGGPNLIPICPLPGIFDFSTLTPGILNNNTNFVVTYHTSANDALSGTAPITVPTLVDGTTTYYYSIRYQDPNNPNNPLNDCRQTGTFKFILAGLALSNATVKACNINNTNVGIFDLTSAAVYLGTATKKYYPTIADLNAGTNEITNPATFSSFAPRTVYVKIETNQGCSGTAEIYLEFLPALPINNVTLSACNNNNGDTGVFDLTAAPVYADNTVTKKFYLSMADLTAGTNEITNPTTYTSTVPKKIYVKVTTTQGCVGTGEITLAFYPVVVVYSASLQSCFIPANPTTAQFDLTTANVTAQTGTTKLYFTTLANANAGTNPIPNPSSYISANGDIFITVTSAQGCYSVARVNLKVIEPVYSTVLKDKTICVEDRTTLDAGPGFAGYEWSTGATTQSISGVAVGSYWVKLKTGNCITTQTVTVKPTTQPVIASLDIANNTITVNATGGTAPYEYSSNGTNWQTSNVLTNLPRGENKVYLRDANKCVPVVIEVTVPNLINAITPNGDNVNDEVDYSALAYKKNLVFTVYNRYGNKVYEADKVRNYKWNGTSAGKKIPTGTYWYTITWNENDTAATQTKYSGWILVKNRE